MDTFIAFLRGINVGGHRKVKMADLKQVHEAMGHGNIITYLQSGNVIFECAGKDSREMLRKIEREYESKLGFHTDVILRNAAELAKISEECPFPLTADREARFLHIGLLASAPESDGIEKLAAYDGPEEWRVAGDRIYIYYPQGAGRSKFTLAFIEKSLGVRGTARNWNTITKLLELAHGFKP